MIAKVLGQKNFAETGGTWEVTEDGIITVTFGGRRSSDAAVVHEAQWFAECLSVLKEHSRDATWTALVDLKNVPEDHRPPHEASEWYTHLLRDERLTKVALVHATTIQRAIVAILLAPIFFMDKIHYFASRGAAEDWLRSEHAHAASVNW
ncbi:MAG: hypothetical protein V1778_03865 [bacterium]